MVDIDFNGILCNEDDKEGLYGIMGVSTQRLLIMIVMINLVLSMSFAMYKAPRVVDYGIVSQTISIGDATADSFSGIEGDTAPENLQEEGSIGSALKMGAQIIKWFVLGLIALPITAGMFGSDPIMNAGAYILSIIWVLMYALIAIEIYFIIKSNKAN